jgi:hypothetical protein
MTTCNARGVRQSQFFVVKHDGDEPGEDESYHESDDDEPVSIEESRRPIELISAAHVPVIQILHVGLPVKVVTYLLISGDTLE